MATQGVTTIKKGDITEIKSLAQPPQLVKVILETTLLLLGHTEKQANDWKYTKSVIGSASFLKTLTEYDVKTIPVDIAMKAKDKIKAISAEEVAKVSAASVSLYKWDQNAINAVLGNSDNAGSKQTD